MAKAKKTDKATTPDDISPNQLEAFPTDRNVILTVNRVDKILGIDRGKSKVKSVLSPSAHIDTLHSPPDAREWTYESFLSSHKAINAYSSEVAAIFAIQFEGACRVSEVLSISPNDIDSFGKITIRSAKGGTIRVVSGGLATQYLLEAKRDKRSPFSYITRHFVYRTYKRFGIGDWYGSNVKMSVTHSIRHEVALASEKAGRKIEITKVQLGQKSTNSTAHYVSEKGKRKSK